MKDKTMKNLFSEIISLLLTLLPVIIIISIGLNHHWAIYKYVAIFIALALIDAFIVPVIIALIMFIVDTIAESKYSRK